MKRILLLAATFAGGYLLAADIEKKQFDSKDLNRVEIRNGSGTIKVSAGGDASTEVIAEKKKFGPHCELAMEKSGQTLVIKAGNRSGAIGECEVAFDVRAPKNVAVKVRAGSSDVAIEKVHGALDFEVGSGAVSVSSEITSLKGMTGSGSVTVAGLLGDASVKSGSGDVRLSYASGLQKGEVTVRTGSGNTEVLLPLNTKVSTDFRSGSGKLFNEIGDSHDAPLKLSVRSGSGNLTIKRN